MKFLGIYLDHAICFGDVRHRDSINLKKKTVKSKTGKIIINYIYFWNPIEKMNILKLKWSRTGYK